MLSDILCKTDILSAHVLGGTAGECNDKFKLEAELKAIIARTGDGMVVCNISTVFMGNG